MFEDQILFGKFKSLDSCQTSHFVLKEMPG